MDLAHECNFVSGLLFRWCQTMTEGSDTRDRVMVQGQQLVEFGRKLDIIAEQVTEMQATLNNTKGAWKVIVVVSGFVGFVVANLGVIKSWLLGH